MHKCNYMYMYNYYLALHSGGGKGRSAGSGDDLWCCGRGRLREGENRRCCAVRWQAKGTLWMRAKGGRAGVERKGYGGRLAAAVTSSFMNSLYFCSVQNKTYVPVEKNEKKKKTKNDYFVSSSSFVPSYSAAPGPSRNRAGHSYKLPLRFLLKTSARVLDARKTQVSIQ